jgi:hypothetical protein
MRLLTVVTPYVWPSAFGISVNVGGDVAWPSALKLPFAGLGALPFAAGFALAEVAASGYSLEGVFFGQVKQSEK